MDIENIIKLIHAVSDSELTEFHYQEGEVNLKLSKKEKKMVMETAVVPVETQKVPVQAAVQEEKTEVPSAEQKPAGKEVTSPLVGTFYSAPSPEEPPFVKVGDTVKKGQTLGIVEAMKLMNEIESEYDGEVKAILVENEEIVEYGQPLFVIG